MLHDRAAAEAYVASVCFKHGPPHAGRGGAGMAAYRPSAPRRLPCEPPRSPPRSARTPARAGPSLPRLPLPGGSLVTVEPGGQVELASPPLRRSRRPGRRPPPRRRLCCTPLGRRGPASEDRAPRDPTRPPLRLLDLPRYRAMEQSFDRIGPHGRSGMCSTAGRAGLPRRRGGRDRRRPLGRAARARARCCSRRSPTRRACTGGAPAGSPRAWALLAARSTPPAPRRPPTRTAADPAGGVGAARAGHPAAVRAAGQRRLDGARAGSRSPTGSRGALPRAADGRRPRLPPDHAVPAGAPPRPPRGALPRRPARQAVGAAGRRAGGAAVATRA